MPAPPRKPHFRTERSLIAGGVWPVAGVDEAGRGPLAGPVAAAAVILNPKDLPKGLDDSKALDEAVREELFDLILAKALAVGIAFASAAEIDRINIRQATFAAMRRALLALSVRPLHAIIDGNDLPPNICCAGQVMVKADATSISVSAASIVAKVVRDRLMRRLHAHHPDYGFDQHVGYATELHLRAIERHGPCPFHRLSFSPFRVDPKKSQMEMLLD